MKTLHWLFLVFKISNFLDTGHEGVHEPSSLCSPLPSTHIQPAVSVLDAATVPFLQALSPSRLQTHFCRALGRTAGINISQKRSLRDLFAESCQSTYYITKQVPVTLRVSFLYVVVSSLRAGT